MRNSTEKGDAPKDFAKAWWFLIVLAATCCTGCAIKGSRPGSLHPPAPPSVNVFYATDREPVEGENNRFGPKRAADGQLSYGVVPICVPPGHAIGHRFPAHERAVCASNRVTESDVDSNGSGREGFFRALSADLDRSGQKQVFVYVPGYNFRFEETTAWTAQLKEDLGFQGVSILYSWPSRGERLRYRADEDSVQWSVPHLEEFLEQILAKYPGERIHLIAHSMGNQALIRALRLMASVNRTPTRLFGEIIFAAPDIDADEFKELAGPILGLGERVTLYVCSKDRALSLSGHIHGRARAGDAKHDLMLISGMDTVDVTPSDRRRSHHTYIVDNRSVLSDVSQLLKDGSPPSQRFGLVPIEKKEILWQIRP